MTDQRCVQFYTGYGLEGDLPDANCKRIQTRDMLPYLKDNQWDEGMVAGIHAVCARLDGSMEADPADGEDGLSIGLILLSFLRISGLVIFIGIWTQRAANRCPQCRKHKLQRSSSILVAHDNGIRTEDVTYICHNCGHKVVRRQRSYDERYQGRNRGGGPVIFGGGGFRGESFGGGSGGGGGAGSHF